MALTRALLADHVANALADALALAGLAGGDEGGALGEPLDQAFLALGIAWDDVASAEVPAGREQAAIAFARYFALRRAWNALGRKMDVGAGGATAKQSQQVANLKAMLDEAAAVAAAYGLVTPGSGGSGSVVAIPIPYAGGIDAGDYAAAYADGDRMPGLFALGDLR